MKKEHVTVNRHFSALMLIFGLVCSTPSTLLAFAFPLEKPRGRLLGSSIESLMTRYGLPTKVAKLVGEKASYEWQFKATMMIESEGSMRSEEFQCNVTVVTLPLGKVVKIITAISNAGTRVLAAIGAFGPLCSRPFDMARRPS